MRERELNDAEAGDGAAALRVVQDALRRGDWQTAARVSLRQMRDTGWGVRLDALSQMTLGCDPVTGDISIQVDKWRPHLPDRLHVRGDLTLDGARLKGAYAVGVDTVVEGALTVSRFEEFRVADRVRAKSAHFACGRGVLNFGEGVRFWRLSVASRGFVLPGSMVVSERVSIDGCNDVRVEAGFTCDGNLYAPRTSGLVLPDGLRIPGRLDLSQSHNPHLGRGMRVGVADFRGVEGLVVPDDLVVHHDFYVDNWAYVPDHLRDVATVGYRGFDY